VRQLVLLIAAVVVILLPDDGGSFWDFNVIELITLIGVVMGLVGATIRWARNRYRRPVQIRYLIPKEKYTLREFPGANRQETLADSLRVGIGTYQLLFQVQVMREIDVLSANLRFVGNGAEHLTDEGPNNLFIIDREPSDSVSLPRFQNWHGEWQNPTGTTWLTGEPRMLGHRIRISGPFIGHLIWVLRIKGRHKPFEQQLALTAHGGSQDDVPFLRLATV